MHSRLIDVNEDNLVCFCDLDVDLMALIYEFDLDILKLYLHPKNKHSRS